MIMLKHLYLIFIVVILLGCKSGEDSNQQAADPTQAEKSDTKETNKQKTILFFGNSLTAGYGVDMNVSFPGLIENRIDSLQLNYKVVNAGLSGETTASGNTRVGWVLSQHVDIFVLELGGNDGLRGITTDETRKNLQSIIDQVSEKYPECVIIMAGMQIPPNMGADYTEEFSRIFPEIAKENNLALIPFLLENVGGEPSLNQNDGIHPNEEGHLIVAENVWKILEPFLASSN